MNYFGASLDKQVIFLCGYVWLHRYTVLKMPNITYCRQVKAPNSLVTEQCISALNLPTAKCSYHIMQ